MEVIKAKNFSKETFSGEYEGTHFIDCTLASTDISSRNLADCIFENCDLSNCNITNTTFSDVTFLKCKMMGLRFDSCNEFIFLASFENCQLDYSSFYSRKVLKTSFRNCKCEEVDFSSADLSESSFVQANLKGAIFDNTKLNKVDFTGASHFIIRPESNSIKDAKFDLEGLPGLLTDYKIKVQR